MKKKQLLLALTGITVASLVVGGVSLANKNTLFTFAGDSLVDHSIVMTTENTTVSIEAGYDFDYFNMETTTTSGNIFGAYDNEIETWSTVHCNTEDALFEVSEEYDTIDLRLYICFDFNLDVEEGENVTACMYYKLKTAGGWDESPTYWDWSGLDAEGNHALFTFDGNFGGVYGFKFISCNFTYSCSY